MDLSAGALFSGMIIGAIGAGVFLFGKKSGNVKCLVIGVLLNVVPFIAPTTLTEWVLAAACLAGLFLPVG